MRWNSLKKERWKKNWIGFMDKNNHQIDYSTKYESAEFLYTVTLESYNRMIANYDAIYNKVNIALAVATGIALAVLSNIDLGVFDNWNNAHSFRNLLILIDFLASLGSVACIGMSMYSLMELLKSQEIAVFDLDSIKDEDLHRHPKEAVVTWVTLKYIMVINENRKLIEKKHSEYNQAITWIIIGLLCYAISVLLRKI